MKVYICCTIISFQEAFLQKSNICFTFDKITVAVSDTLLYNQISTGSVTLRWLFLFLGVVPSEFPSSQSVATIKTAALTHCWAASKHLWQALMDGTTPASPCSLHLDKQHLLQCMYCEGCCKWPVLPFQECDHMKLLPLWRASTLARICRFISAPLFPVLGL